ncbi:hypothetical protein ACJU26_05370 [Acidithiobacillus sp. M4-SHS-6]|uniref:hypothetical protein n=1 Tax=Acidithiobacillus sp. M4-SHS-6 TaxID=3383024 RepID=UPI0039BE879E
MNRLKAISLILVKILLFVVIGTVITRYVDIQMHIPFDKGTWLVGLMAIWTGLSVPEWIFQTWIKYRDGETTGFGKGFR